MSILKLERESNAQSLLNKSKLRAQKSLETMDVTKDTPMNLKQQVSGRVYSNKSNPFSLSKSIYFLHK